MPGVFLLAIGAVVAWLLWTGKLTNFFNIVMGAAGSPGQ